MESTWKVPRKFLERTSKSGRNFAQPSQSFSKLLKASQSFSNLNQSQPISISVVISHRGGRNMLTLFLAPSVRPLSPPPLRPSQLPRTSPAPASPSCVEPCTREPAKPPPRPARAPQSPRRAAVDRLAPPSPTAQTAPERRSAAAPCALHARTAHAGPSHAPGSRQTAPYSPPTYPPS